MTLPEPMLAHERIVEIALRRVFSEHAGANLPLYRMMQYQLGWLARDGSEEAGPMPLRFHGALCVEAATSIGEVGFAGDSAAAVELLTHSALVHEQMQNSQGPSEERAAVWWVWGPAQAINVGDGLHAFARLVAFGLQARGLSADHTLQAVAGLDAAALKYYEGQYLDLTYQERIDVTEAQYVRMVTAKRGALLGGAMALGAQVAEATDDVVSAFREFGESLGLALQIRDDIGELWPIDKRYVSPRVLNKTKLLPVVYALETGSIADKRAIGEVYFKRVMEPDDLPAIRRALEGVGARAHAEERKREATTFALTRLGDARLTQEAARRWEKLVQGLVGD